MQEERVRELVRKQRAFFAGGGHSTFVCAKKRCAGFGKGSESMRRRSAKRCMRIWGRRKEKAIFVRSAWP